MNYRAFNVWPSRLLVMSLTCTLQLGFNIKTMDYRGYKLNVWDVGGQKTLRSYWRNYFESTDGMIWVVDSADRRRLGDCLEELGNLLSQEKLAGASLLVFANKQDLAGSMTSEEIAEVRASLSLLSVAGSQCPAGCTTAEEILGAPQHACLCISL